MSRDLADLLRQATLHHRAARVPEAEALYREILTAAPDHADALHQYGVLAYQAGQHDAAIDLIGRALRRHPDRAAFHNSLGSVHLASGRTAEAADAFRRALALAPASFEIRNNLANALQTDGAFADAAAAYRAALAAAPGNPDIHNNLGRTLHLMGDFAGAVDHFRRASEIKPDDAEILGNLGNALQRVGRLAEAVAAYRRAVALAPATPAFHKNLGLALAALGDDPGADASFAALLALDSSAAALRDLGHTYYALGKQEQAVSAFRRALEREPDDRDCLFGLGVALTDLGRAAEGLDAIARGPGIAHLSLTAEKDGNTVAPPRIQEQTASPDFIGRWFMAEPVLCDRLINLFEARAGEHTPGRTSAGVNMAVKRSTDLVICPNDLDKPENAPVNAYLCHLQACARDYAVQWPALGEILKAADVAPFNIQRYDVGGHFQLPHCERFTAGLSHRVLAWMTYLNDVEADGETVFHNFGLRIRPERGKTLIWPVEWTHMHAGKPVGAGRKYIITGWMHFPHPRPSSRQ